MKRRNTIQKILVLEAVNALNNHPTAEEVYEFVVKKHPYISRATVYRNLNLLGEEEQIKRIEIPGSPIRYDIYTHNHYHFKCEVCGSVYDVEMDYIDNLEKRAANLDGFVINNHNLTFRGVCLRCNSLKK